MRILKTTYWAFIIFVSVFLLSACAKNLPEPQVASSADSPGYAAAFPGNLSENLSLYAEDEVISKQSTDSFRAYPSALKEPDWAVVNEAYILADKAGRGSEFADAMAEQKAVKRFFSEEKDDIARRTNGAVANAIEKANCKCDVETGGAVTYGIKEGVEKRLKKRLAAIGGLDEIIEENEKLIGKKNIKTLEEQTAAIAYCAYIVYVEMPTLYQTVSRQLQEVGDVKKTIEKEIEKFNKIAGDPAASKGDRRRAEKELETLNGALTTVDIFKAEANRFVKESETKIPTYQKLYDDTVETLIDESALRRSKQ